MCHPSEPHPCSHRPVRLQSERVRMGVGLVSARLHQQVPASRHLVHRQCDLPLKSGGLRKLSGSSMTDLPHDAISSVTSFLKWGDVGRCTQLNRQMQATTQATVIWFALASASMRSWRQMARDTRTAWQAFMMWRMASQASSDEREMMQDLEDLMNEDVCQSLSDEEFDFLDDQMMKATWEGLLKKIVAKTKED